MRPVKLMLAGFTSFRDQQVLDFSVLDLFAITGPTGAGKSSLLDAITFALYGKVARLGRDSGAELVSLGASQLTVELQFMMQQTLYKVARNWRYRPSGAKTDFLLEKYQQGKWLPCERGEKIEAILRMDFNTFTRVILLPQGQFDEFLKGTASKRRQLLRQLGGLEIFENMREEASRRFKTYKSKREAIAHLLADLQAPAISEIEANQTRLAALERDLERLKAQAMQAQQALEAETALLAQLQRFATVQARWAALTTQATAIQTWQQRLQQAQTANRLQGEWGRLAILRQQVGEAQKTVEQAAAHLAQAQTTRTTQQQIYAQEKDRQAQLAVEWTTRERALATIQLLETQQQQQAAEVKQALEKQRRQAQQHSTAKKAYQAAQTEHQAVQQQLAAAYETQQVAPDEERLAQLNQVINLLPAWQTARQAAHKSQQKLAQMQAAYEQCQQQQKARAAQLKTTEAAWQQVTTRLQQAESSNVQALQNNQAAAIRQSLTSGDTCPVCGHAYEKSANLPALPVLETHDLTPLRQAVRTSEQAYQKAMTASAQITATLAALETQQADGYQDWQALDAEQSAGYQHISTCLQTTTWQAAALIQQHETLLSQQASYQKALLTQEKLTATLEKVAQQLDFTAQTYQAAQHHLAESQAEVAQRQNQLEAITNQLSQLTQGQSYLALQQQLTQDKQTAAAQLHHIETAYQTALQRVIEAQQNAEQAQAQLTRLSSQQATLEQHWQAALQAVDFTEERFQAAHATVAEQTDWQQKINDYQQQRTEVQTLLTEMQQHIGARTTDEQAVAQLQVAKQQADAHLNQAEQARLHLSHWLHTAQANRQRAEKLTVELNALIAQEETYHVLSLKLRSDEFQAYLLTHLETDLVTRATVLLQALTDNRYALKIQAGEYWVADNWHGGELRRVRTLSGGETFAASLAMALALSERLSQGATLGSLFLDEGFGTLDAETLEVVTHILEALRQQDRLIGVITHITALAERLPMQVQVHKSPTGSHLQVETV